MIMIETGEVDRKGEGGDQHGVEISLADLDLAFRHNILGSPDNGDFKLFQAKIAPRIERFAQKAGRIAILPSAGVRRRVSRLVESNLQDLIGRKTGGI